MQANTTNASIPQMQANTANAANTTNASITQMQTNTANAGIIK